MNNLPVVDWLTLDTIYTLTDAVTAFWTSQDERDADRCGPICELPEGAELMVSGGGFSKRTVRVRYGDCEYYVLWRDLASAKAEMPQFLADRSGCYGLARCFKVRASQ
jgi:hypothetical protein